MGQYRVIRDTYVRKTPQVVSLLMSTNVQPANKTFTPTGNVAFLKDSDGVDKRFIPVSTDRYGKPVYLLMSDLTVATNSPLTYKTLRTSTVRTVPTTTALVMGRRLQPVNKIVTSTGEPVSLTDTDGALKSFIPVGTDRYGKPLYLLVSDLTPYDASQASYGQPQYGQPAYGQNQYGQAPYGQPQYGQTQYGQAAYGRGDQTVYTPPAYQQAAPSGQTVYTPPPYQQPASSGQTVYTPPPYQQPYAVDEYSTETTLAESGTSEESPDSGGDFYSAEGIKISTIKKNYSGILIGIAIGVVGTLLYSKYKLLKKI